MTTKSDNFEKQVKRIYDILVQDKATVTWNHKIKDPDNPAQLRQIDIAVIRNEIVTHIECRDHKSPQDAKWIEELYGRKVSLKASLMIGVSSSGFTKGALKKANRFGIFLFNLSNLSDGEIESWGKKTNITWYYYTFRDLEIYHFIENMDGLEQKEIETYIYSKPEVYTELFNQLKIEFNKDEEIIYPYSFIFRDILCERLNILGRRVISISIRGKVDKVPYHYSCPYVMSYHTQGHLSLPIASIEKTDYCDFEIIKSINGCSSVTLDLSIAPQGPTNSVLAAIFQLSDLPVSEKYPPKINIIGTHKKKFHLDGAQITITEIEH